MNIALFLSVVLVYTSLQLITTHIETHKYFLHLHVYNNEMIRERQRNIYYKIAI